MPPTVVLVPAWDDLFGYLPLADALVGSGEPALDRTIIGLQYRVPSADHGVRTVPELAAIFVDDLTSAGHEGPFLLVGWSTSGVVAYELGVRLDQRGHDVTIALVDTFFPGQEKRLWANRWVKYSTLARPGRLSEAGREMGTTVRRRGRQQAARLGRALQRWAEPETAPAPSREAAPVSEVIPAEAFDYDPPPTSVPVVMYSASTTPRSRTVDPWRRVAPQLEIVSVEGRHRGLDSVMGADRVGPIAADLRTRLAEGRDQTSQR